MFTENAYLGLLVIAVIGVCILALVGVLLKRRTVAMALTPLVDPKRQEDPVAIDGQDGWRTTVQDPVIAEAIATRDIITEEIKKAIEFMLVKKDYAKEVERIVRLSIGDVPLTYEAIKAAIPQNSIGMVGLFYTSDGRLVIRINHCEVHGNDKHNLIIQLMFTIVDDAFTIQTTVSGLTVIDQLEHYSLGLIDVVLDRIIKASPYYFHGKGQGTVLYPCRLNNRETINVLSHLYTLTGIMQQSDSATIKVLNIFRAHDPENTMRYWLSDEMKVFSISIGSHVQPDPETDLKNGPSYVPLFQSFNSIEKNFDCSGWGLNRVVIEYSIDKLLDTLRSIDISALAHAINESRQQNLSVKDQYIDVVLGEYLKEGRLLIKPNRTNTYYTEEELKTSVARIKERHYVVSELGYPSKLPGVDSHGYFERVSQVDITNAGAIIDGKTINFVSSPDKVVITAKAKMLTDLKGLKFGIRGMVKTEMDGDKTIERMTNIITWDLIPADEPAQ